MSENIQKRVTKAMEELKEKHRTGTNEIDDEDKAPTGPVYRANAQKLAYEREKIEEQKRYQKEQEKLERLEIQEKAKRIFANEDAQIQNTDLSDDDDSDDDDEYLNELENDPELEAIRNQRLLQLKQAQIQKAENLAKGHGQYRTITQDEFLSECTGSIYVAVHFFHEEFERCKIMDYHLKIIAPIHTSCKFVRIDAVKAPFFVSKLIIKTLPTLIVFREGKVVDRLTGFAGLSINANDPDKWHTGKLQQWISTTGAIKYEIPTEEIREEMERLGMKPKGSVWSGFKGDVRNDYDF